jgi:predicted ATPase
MLLLQVELDSDRDVYILDEPEKSLGNEYISEVIVPRIRERARSGKKVFISTHDANIAVRTLPYSSVYRCHGEKGYCTYVGNPFCNDLVNLNDDTDRLDWKKVSMTTLEGGERAFGERGQIYGQS